MMPVAGLRSMSRVQPPIIERLAACRPSLIGWSSGRLAEQIRDLHTERLRKRPEVRDPDVALSPLDVTDDCPWQPGSVRQFLL